MNQTQFSGEACERVILRLDRFIDKELPDESADEIRTHLAACGACAGELGDRTLLRSRLKKAVAGEPAAPGIEARIRRSLRAPESVRRPGFWMRPAFVVGLAAVLLLGITVAYQLGSLRFTADSHEAFYQSISGRVASIMRVGLGDHVHCAVFRKFPKTPPAVEEMVGRMGPEYSGLIEVVRKQIPLDFRIVLAHHCRYHDRKFVHLTMRNGSKLVSLVIARKVGAESFANDLRPALSQSGIPIYRDGAQRFEIAGFETGSHLVYIVSDMGRQGNMTMLASLAPALKDFLINLES